MTQVDKDEAGGVESLLSILEAKADEWAEEVGLLFMIKNVTSPVLLTRKAPDAVRERFKQRMESQMDALLRQAFIEGMYRGACYQANYDNQNRPVEAQPTYCLDDMIAAMTPENTDVGEIDTGQARGNEFPG